MGLFSCNRATSKEALERGDKEDLVVIACIHNHSVDFLVRNASTGRSLGVFQISKDTGRVLSGLKRKFHIAWLDPVSIARHNRFDR